MIDVYYLVVIKIKQINVKVIWPSGLRRQFKALVREGVGSNPTVTIFSFEYNNNPYFFFLSAKTSMVLKSALFNRVKLVTD